MLYTIYISTDFMIFWTMDKNGISMLYKITHIPRTKTNFNAAQIYLLNDNNYYEPLHAKMDCPVYAAKVAADKPVQDAVYTLR